MYGNAILLKYDKYTNVLTSYEFMLPCMWFMYLALLDHSMPDYVSRVLTIKSMVHGVPGVLHCTEESHTGTYQIMMLSCKNHVLLLTESHSPLNY